MFTTPFQALSRPAVDHQLTSTVPIDYLRKAMDSPPEGPWPVQSIERADHARVFSVP